MMGLFDNLVSSFSSSMAKAEEERKKVRRMNDFQLQELYKRYVDNDEEQHWRCRMIADELTRRGHSLSDYRRW